MFRHALSCEEDAFSSLLALDALSFVARCVCVREREREVTGDRSIPLNKAHLTANEDT